MHVQRQMKGVSQVEVLRKPVSPGAGSSVGVGGIDPVSSSDDSGSLPPYQPPVLDNPNPSLYPTMKQESKSRNYAHEEKAAQLFNSGFNIYHRLAQAEEIKKKIFGAGPGRNFSSYSPTHFPIGPKIENRNLLDEDDEEDIDVDA